jgi:hypothetical protein
MCQVRTYVILRHVMSGVAIMYQVKPGYFRLGHVSTS